MISDPYSDLPAFDDLLDAAKSVEGVVIRTPLLRADFVDRLIKRPVWFKAENLQRTGSFKMRGAWNRCSRIPDRDRPRGVVAYSSGNHAQGVAASAQLLDVPATIVMPADAPAAKRAATASLGASIRLYDRQTESREAIGQSICDETGATLIRPFDDAYVIAGQGTATLEALEDLKARNVTIDTMLCPASGGGLLGGAGLALAELAAGVQLCVVEPEGHDDHRLSIESGRHVDNAPGFRSIADALLAPRPGDLTFQLNRSFVRGSFAVADDDILRAMRLAFDTLKVVLEPGGATALAGLIRFSAQVPGDGAILVMLSGGNVDAAMFQRALEVAPV